MKKDLIIAGVCGGLFLAAYMAVGAIVLMTLPVDSWSDGQVIMFRMVAAWAVAACVVYAYARWVRG